MTIALILWLIEPHPVIRGVERDHVILQKAEAEVGDGEEVDEIDALPDRSRLEGLLGRYPNAIGISAHKGTGMAQLAGAHDADYLDDLKRFCAGGGGAIDADTYRQQCTVTTDFADAPIHNNGKLWYLVGCRKRPMAPDALLHPSVLQRRRDNPDYLPNLTAEQQQRSAQHTDWTDPAL